MSEKDIVTEAREVAPYVQGVADSSGGGKLSRVPELLRVLADEVETLRDLVVHMHVHSGYRNNGYMQMTTPQKALYDAIWQRSVAELDAEEESHAKH